MKSMNFVKIISVGKRGQIVIPKRVREYLGIGKDDKLILYVVDDVIILRRLSISSILEELREIFSRIDKRIEEYGELTDEEIIAEIKKSQRVK